VHAEGWLEKEAQETLRRLKKRGKKKKKPGRWGSEAPPLRAKSSFLTAGIPFPVIFFPKVTIGSKKLKKKLPKNSPLLQHFVPPIALVAVQRQPFVSSLALVAHPTMAASLANHPLYIAPSLPLTAGSLFMRNMAAKLIHIDNSRTPSSAINNVASNWELHPQHCLQPRLVTTTAAEGTLLSFPPRLKQQPPASAISLHFQQSLLFSVVAVRTSVTWAAATVSNNSCFSLIMVADIPPRH